MFYQIQVPKPWTRTSDYDRHWEMMDQVVMAEELGFESVWMPDHQFRTEWSHSSAPDVTLAAISQRTSRIRLGIAVVVPPVQHPLHIAARTATLDILSNGRVDLGVGRSGYPYQMAAFGVDLNNATGMVDEALEIIPQAWTEGEFSYQGKYFDIPSREVHPKPVQTPHPPIWLGCSQEETFQKAGELGLGCLAMSGGGPDRLTKLIQTYRDGIRNAKPVSKLVTDRVSISTLAICTESRKEAQERGAEIID
jgi:alkanesulfonate monooxygenase SsuD/methylene tetrahydromethanopterin reductase-like flavin-dependent oxidoreductase (luciferase family)